MVLFQKAAIKAKLAAWFWTDIVGGERMDIPDENLNAVKGPLNKIYPFKGPDWVVALKDRITAAKKAKAASSAAAAASSAAASSAPVLESAAIAPAAAGSAPDKEHSFSVGDTVILGRPVGVGKACQNEEARIDKITDKTISITVLSGKLAGNKKTFKPNQMELKLQGVHRHTGGP